LILQRGFLFALMLVMLTLASGCESPEAEAVLAGDKTDGTFVANVELCRKVSKKSGRRIGVGDEFRITSKSNVRAYLDVEEAVPGRTYTWHLSWVRPDGKEMFRKFAEVTLNEGPDGYETTIQWKKAEDLHYLKEKVITSDDPSYTLATKFNISESKERVPGDYRFRVYLDRKFLMEKEFTVLAN
jgi:hypothetical protein